MTQRGPCVDLLLRSDAETKGGGDLVQANAYADALRTTRHDVRLVPWSAGYVPERGTIVHYMNADRAFELVRSARAAARVGAPFIVSPIHHPAGPLRRMRAAERGHSLRALAARLPESLREFMAFTARVRRDRSSSTLRRVTAVAAAAGDGLALRARVRAVLTNADAVLVLTADEAESLERDLSWRDARSLVIGNGIPVFDPAPHERTSEILVVGRIEQRKRQLELLRAAERLEVPLRFVGALNPNAGSYADRFAAEVSTASYCRWEGAMPHQAVTERMRCAAVVLNFSWAEVQSLVEIEAATAGCWVVVNGDTGSRRWLGDVVRKLPADEVDGAIRIAAELAAGSAAPPTVYRTTWADAGGLLAAEYDRVAPRHG